MPVYAELAREALESTHDALTREYESFKAKGLALNMARGKPSRAQLDLSMPMLPRRSALWPLCSTMTPNMWWCSETPA